jgi:nucleoid-associated protein YgaU
MGLMRGMGEALNTVANTANQAQQATSSASEIARSAMGGPGANNAAAGAGGGNLVRAFLKQQSGSLRFDFLFNPTELTFVKENKWATSTRKGQNMAQSEFLGGEPTTFTLHFVLDTSEENGPARSVRNKMQELNQLVIVDSNSRDPSNHLGSPPVLEFHWGVSELAVGTYVISKRSVKYTRFDPDGVATRAEVDLSLQQWSDNSSRPRQNPTSGGAGEQRYYQVRPGQTLDLVAYEIYGDSTRWRAIAEANGLDNPLDLRPGQMLRISEEY